MRTRVEVIAFVVVLLGVFGLALWSGQHAAAQEQPKQALPEARRSQEQPAPAGQQAFEEMMAKWAELNQKGPEHERFKKMVGTWDTASKMWMAPDAPPLTSQGTAEFRLLLDGRYVEQIYKCPAMGEGQPPYEGRGIEGYDRMKKKYVSVWMDNMSTGFMLVEGSADESGKVFTYTGTYNDPMTGQKNKPYRAVLHVLNDDKMTYEMHETDANGKEFKSMEITYTRRK